jgi:hypothetical protein
MKSITRPILILLAWLAAVPFAVGQSAPFRHDLLSLIPDDFAVCFVLHDLKGNAIRWEKSDWLKSFRASALGKSLLEGPEMRQLERVQADLKKHLDLDWPTLRDDLLGDTLILAYTPGPKSQPDDERGLFLLHARKPERLRQLIDRLNEAQKSSGELKELTELQYRGNAYYRRKQDGKTQFYFVKDSLLAFTGKEELLRAFFDRRAGPANESRWVKRFKQAGVDQAILSMCVNPRALDAELAANSKKDDPFPTYWRALDAIFVTLAIQDAAELRLSIQAHTELLPKWAGSTFTRTAPISPLWDLFPEQSIMTIAAQTDFAGLGDTLKMLMPETDRKKLTSDWKGSVGAIVQLDLFNDLLPNIGPDWGVCVLPSKDAKQLPQAIVALAVKPGSTKQPVDQRLVKAIEIFASIAVLEHNKNNPNAPIRLETVLQGKTDVKFLAGEKAFPLGIAPAFALKDGFLLVASAPEAIERFKLPGKKPSDRRETPLVRISAPELARLLEQRREHILSSLPQKDAKQHLENVIGLLRMFDQLTLSHRGESGQASWTLRLSPAASKQLPQ